MAVPGRCQGSVQSMKERLRCSRHRVMCLDQEWAVRSENWSLGVHAEKKRAGSKEGGDAKKGEKRAMTMRS